MIAASVTDVYLPTLSTVSTALALAVAYLARTDRRQGAVERWLEDFQLAQERVAQAVVDLTEAARADFLAQKEKSPLWEAATDGLPPSMRVPRMKLRAALAGLPTAGLSLPEVRALATANQKEVIEGADKAIDEIAQSLNALARGSAIRRQVVSHGPVKKWRIRRAFKKAGLGDPYS